MKTGKRCFSLLLAMLLTFGCTTAAFAAGAADAETEQSCSPFMQSGIREKGRSAFVQDSALDLIMEEYASVFTYNPESIGEIMEDIKDEFGGFFLISAFGGFLYVPLLMPAVFLRLVIGTFQVIAAGIRNEREAERG